MSNNYFITLTLSIEAKTEEEAISKFEDRLRDGIDADGLEVELEQ